VFLGKYKLACSAVVLPIAYCPGTKIKKQKNREPSSILLSISKDSLLAKCINTCDMDAICKLFSFSQDLFLASQGKCWSSAHFIPPIIFGSGSVFPIAVWRSLFCQLFAVE